MKILCVIPARYASTRLPGKPLADIVGKPMIQHVYERSAQATIPQQVVVATDDEKVFQAVQQFGGKVVMTSSEHQTGTDRLAEVASKYAEVDVIINVQGDEPLIDPKVIDELAQEFLNDTALQMASVMSIMDTEDYQNPNAVKVVTDLNNNALYFSRSLLPYPRVAGKANVYKHIGIYAYKKDFLLKFAKLEPTPLEQSESLEQLRALENGYKIKMIKTKSKFIGVDSIEDLQTVNELLRK
ncbi:MAG: 3-deoxy-manno-octulosonate cytidylyltransferase [Negativicutes bacterium]|jgi:3-deoxy-manno-octulosonate cytidylyltransferase (CMP-KDO synthetase)|nr:3-deoxy-manno-octulosonate cytidylyltransferase [Negativicutes bacterium]MBP8629886.1 3-deoxy-manno-octulosonate cytidylyltransferase [Negativicutes bacterium]